MAKSNSRKRVKTARNRAKSEPQRKQTISAVEAAAKLILTLAEASVLTHIPVEVLRREVRSGNLRGVIRGRGWKVNRAHLEEYVASLYVPRKGMKHVAH